MTDILKDGRCGDFAEQFRAGKLKIRTILHEHVAQTNEEHTVYFIKVPAGGKGPCELQPPHNPDTKCFIIRQNVKESDGQTTDWYLMNCPHGPPCDFLDSI